MLATIQSIIELYAAKGGARYGSELVSQLEHALQCAQLAHEEGARAELVAAAFLHDVGHLVIERPHFMGREIDNLHQYVGLPLLRRLFGPAVLEPIRLHVEAKRYLCHAEAGYWERLAPSSKYSLELQGGPFSAVEAGSFLGRLHAREAIRLRRWDDRARLPGQSLRDLDFAAAVLEKAAGCHKTAMVGA